MRNTWSNHPYMQSYTFSTDLVFLGFATSVCYTIYSFTLTHIRFLNGPQNYPKFRSRVSPRFVLPRTRIHFFYAISWQKRTSAKNLPRRATIVMYSNINNGPQHAMRWIFFFLKSKTKLKLPRKPRTSRGTDQNRCISQRNTLTLWWIISCITKWLFA